MPLCVQIIMIRGDDTDDVIDVSKDMSTNEYVITYSDPNEGEPVVHQMSGLYRDKVLEYVYMLLKNQYVDEEGFDKVQVNIPAMPRVIVSGEKFNQVYYREHFQELIGFGLDNLENTGKVVTTPKRPALRTPVVPPAPARLSAATRSYTGNSCSAHVTSYAPTSCCAQPTSCGAAARGSWNRTTLNPELEEGECYPVPRCSRHLFFDEE
jgi:hypothetical protein